MPSKPKTFQTIPTTQRYEQSQQRQDDRSFYHSKAWLRLRDWYLRQHPLCECGCLRPAEEVHHVKDRKQYPELALDPDNLEV